LYIDYLTNEYGRLESDFVFINLWKEPVGAPMTYKGASDLFARLSRKTGIRVTPHMLRHTHATQLIADGWEPMLVQKRLGHSSVQTTITTYVHVPPETLTKAYKKYLETKNTVGGEEQGHGEREAGGEPSPRLP
jgi:integrase